MYNLFGVVYFTNAHFFSRFKYQNFVFEYDGLERRDYQLHKSKCKHVPSLIIRNNSDIKINYLLYVLN